MEFDEFLGLPLDDQLGVIADQDRKACVYNIAQANTALDRVLRRRLVRVLLRLPYSDLERLHDEGVVFVKREAAPMEAFRLKVGGTTVMSLPVELVDAPVGRIDWTIACELAHVLLGHANADRTSEQEQAAAKWATGWGLGPPAETTR
jgi:hypothetical protein